MGNIKADKKKGFAKSGLLIAFIIFSLALGVRFIYLYESSANPSFQTPIVDSDFYDEIARKFAAGEGMGKDFFWQPFFYPFFLSVVYFFSGGSIVWAKIIQVLIGGLTCALTYKLGEVIFDRRVGIIAALVTIFYGPMLFFESELLATGWATFWAVVVVWLFLKVKEQDKIWHWFLLGLCGTLSIITRPTFLPFFVAGCIWLRLRLQRSSPVLIRFGAVTAGILLIAVPVGIASQRNIDKFSILPSSGGINLYIGNNPDYCETLMLRPGEEWGELIKLPWRQGVRTVKGQDRFFKQKVMEYAINQPLDFAAGLGRKTLGFVCSREMPRNISIYVLRRWSRLLSLLTWKVGGFGFPFGVILPLSALGIVFNRRRIPAPVILFIVLYPLSVILVFVSSRYKMPVVPIFAILAAAGLVSIFQRARSKRRRDVAVMAIVAAGIIMLSTLPGPFCQEQEHYEPEFFKSVGRLKSKRGLNDEAMACFSEAVRLEPGFAEAYYFAGETLMQQNKLSEAEQYYRDALRFKPDYPLAHANLGVVLLEQGKVDEAVEHYNEALRLKPEFPEVHYYLGVICQMQRRVDEAIRHYREALRLKPNFPQAIRNLASLSNGREKTKNPVKP